MKKYCIFFVILLTAGTISAQTTASQQTSLQLSNALTMSFTNGSGAALNTVFNNGNQMNAGVQTPDQYLSISSNKPFQVSMAPATANFTYTGAAVNNNVVAVHDAVKVKLQNNLTGGSNLLGNGWNFFDGGVTILTGCLAGDAETFTIAYHMHPGNAHAAGTYSVNVIYTATQL